MNVFMFHTLSESNEQKIKFLDSLSFLDVGLPMN